MIHLRMLFRKPNEIDYKVGLLGGSFGESRGEDNSMINERRTEAIGIILDQEGSLMASSTSSDGLLLG